MLTKSQFAWNKIALLTICDLARGVNIAPVTNVVIQKHMFLTELAGRKKNVKAAYYRFYRYKHGPFSTALSGDIADFETGGFIDSESGELLDRGKYLLEYVRPETETAEHSEAVLGVIERTVEQWRAYRGWSIVDAVYDLQVPVDSLGHQEMLVRDIPLKTDILVPEWSREREFQPFPPDLVDDIWTELAIPSARIDPTSEELRHRGSLSLEEALARS